MTRQEVELVLNKPLPMLIKSRHQEQYCTFTIRNFEKEDNLVWGFATLPNVWFEIPYSIDYTKLNKTENGFSYDFITA